jgi:hypothetical protein
MPETDSSFDHPLRSIVKAWLEKIRKGCQFKEKQFGADARICTQFFNGPYDFMYKSDFSRKASHGFGYIDEGGEGSISFAEPSCQMTMNKVAEGVQIFGPVLYHKNPYRQVNPRKLPELPYGLLAAGAQDPQQQMMLQQFEQSLQQATAKTDAEDIARASLLEWVLNWTPREFDLKREYRLGIDETMITGSSCIWTEMYQPKSFPAPMVGSFYDSIANLVLDPDPTRREDCMWIARKCCHPVWKVERDYKLEPGSVKGDAESYNQQAEVSADGDGDYKRKKGETNDLCTYWKLYSKMGVGARIKGVPEEYRQVLEEFGDYAYLVMKEGVPFPLNLPPAVLNDPNGKEEAFRRLEWPTPYWLSDDWPCEILALHDAPNQIYPISHFKPVMGQLIFLNWIMSFVATKIRVASRDFIACKKSVGDELKRRILTGSDFTLLELDVTHPGTIQEVVQFLQHPNFNGDIWKVVEWMMEQFEKGSGLTELQYGMTTTQMRSAQEANIKSSAMNVRPDDMAARIEDSTARVAKREACALRWHVPDVTPFMGPAANVYWQRLVAGSDPLKVFHQLEYSVEEGSTRKPNKERDAANVNQALTTFFPAIAGRAAATGDYGRYNDMLRVWGKAVDMDVGGLVEPDLPPPPQQTGPTEEDQRAQEMQQDEQAHGMRMRHDQQKHQQDLRQQKEKAAAAKKIDAAKVKKAKSTANGAK